MDTMNLYPVLSFLFRRSVKMAISLAGTHQTQICRQEWGSSEYFKVLYYLIKKHKFAHFKIGKESRNERCQESFQYNQPFGMQGQTFIHWFLCTMYYANNNKLHNYIETSPRVWKLIFRQKQNSSSVCLISHCERRHDSSRFRVPPMPRRYVEETARLQCWPPRGWQVSHQRWISGNMQCNTYASAKLE